MKAAVLTHPGGPDNLRIENRPIPISKDGWVVVRVKAFGLNRSELMTRKGLSPGVKFPRVLGIECVGLVEDDPSGQYNRGQQVAACMGGMGRDFDGGYSEYTLLPKALLYPFNSNLSWDKLGAVPEMFQTVYGSLYTSLKIAPGEKLLIRGGTSSVGLLAAQMARNSGLTVVSTTRNPKSVNLLLNNGANEVILDNGAIAANVKRIFPDGVDKVLELVGAATLKDSLSATVPGGIVCMTGMLSEQWSISDFAPMEFIPAAVALTIYDSGQIRSDSQSFQNFISDIESNRIKLPLSKVFSLSEIADAHKLMDSNLAGGKIVVIT